MQRQFQRKFNMWQGPARSAISHLIQKFELTRSVRNNRKGVTRRHKPARMQDNIACVHEALLQSPRKCGTMFPVTHSQYQTNINTWDLMLYPYNIQVVQKFIAANKLQRHELCWDFLQFVQQCLCSLPPWTAYGLVMNPISILVGSWTSRTQDSEPLKIHTESWRHHSSLQNVPCGVQLVSKY
jgi:hypothetical protein